MASLLRASIAQIPEIPGAFYVLVVGETGSGKSTLVNAMVNYFRGGSLKCIKIAIPNKSFPTATEPEASKSTENDIHDTTTSNTVGAVPYVLKRLKTAAGLENKTFVLVDTPGLSDTNGVGQDDLNIGTILDAANKCPSLSAIILVANGTVARFSTNVRVTLSRLNGNIPDIALKNIVYVMTNCASKASSNFDVTKAPFGPKYVCYMNNSAFSSNPKTWTARDMPIKADDWRASMFVVQELCLAIMKMGSITTGMFAQMREQRDLVKSTLHEARVKVEELQTVQNSILDIEAKMRRAKEDQSRFKDYTRQKTVETVDWTDTPYHNTICSTCSVVCHENCGLEEVAVAGDCRFLACQAFNGAQHCHVCCGETRCGHSTHYHARKLPTKKSGTLEEVLHDVKASYDEATDGLQKATLEMDTLNGSKKVIQDYIGKLSATILDSCKGIKDICKGFNFAEEMSILIQQLEAHRVMLTDPLARDAAQSFIDSIKAILQGLHADKDSLKLSTPVIGPYVTIECVEVLTYTPGNSPDSSPRAATSKSTASSSSAATKDKHVTPVDEEAEANEAAAADISNVKLKCSKCKGFHDSLFSCPKLQDGWKQQSPPVVATATTATTSAVPPVSPPSASSSSFVPPTPPSHAASATDAPPTAAAASASTGTTSGGSASAPAAAGFETLSNLMGGAKFSATYLPKLGGIFETEEDLKAYADVFLAKDNVSGLKAELVADCGLTGPQALTLAGYLQKMTV